MHTRWILVCLVACAGASEPEPAQRETPPEEEALPTTASPASPQGEEPPLPEIAELPELVVDAREALRHVVELGGASVAASFYERRGYAPAWFGERGLSSMATTLRRHIEEASSDGLDPADYSMEEIDAGVAAFENARGDTRADAVARLDVLLTDAYFLLGTHLLQGRVSPATIHPTWTATARSADLTARLESSIAEQSLDETMASLTPGQREYAAAREALARYRTFDAWPRVGALARGDEGAHVAALRQRLARVGDLSEPGPPRFDDELTHALMRFQRRHGLRETGEADDATRRALNVPLEARVAQLRADLERWRWLPDDLGVRHVRVNIANYSLEAFERGTVALRLRAMVGKPYRKTPVFSDAISHIVLNPRWNVPRQIATRDLLTEARRNPRYLEQRNIRVYSADGSEVNVRDVPWRTLSQTRFPYNLRQDPGASNALGRIKFMFPNAHAVYLHDTPRRDLFDEPERAFSSGCVRVDNPMELADFLLRGQGDWDRSRLDTALEQRREQTIRLETRVPVHLLYWTSWVDDDGTVHFREDIYERNAALTAALNRAQPGSHQ